MDDEGKRREGMMWLTPADVGDNDGMIFAFPGVQQMDNGFWMHNTLLPLDIMYISDQKKLINVQEGKPLNETSLQASAAYEYVLEMKQGSAKRLGLKPGIQFSIPDSVK